MAEAAQNPDPQNSQSFSKLLGVQNGKAPLTRLSSPAALLNIYTEFKILDDESSRNRAAVDAMFDGEPPYSDAELEAAGQSDICNVDFGEAGAALDQALTGYYDLTNSVDVMARVMIKYGTDITQKTEWEAILSEEFHRLVKSWPQFEANFQRLCKEFVKHGVSFSFFDNDKDWRWRPTGWNGFLIERTTPVGETEIEMAIAERTFKVHQLWKFIADPKTARKAGWNVRQVEKALTRAYMGASFKPNNWRNDWEKLQRDLKDNDLGVSYSCSNVEVIHAWVQEFDGKVSHYISLQDGTNSDFLFKKASRYDSMMQGFIAFTYGVGNGYYHSIRGLGFKLFPQIQMSNRLQGRAIDGAMFASSTMIQPEDEKALQNLELTYVGPYVVLPPKTNVVERNLSNVASQVLPLVQHLSMQAANNTGTYRAQAVAPDGAERTAREVTLEAQQEAVLSTSAMNLFYIPWKKLLNEMMRRVINPKLLPNDPGAVEVREFIKRCKDRGVPEAAIRSVECVEPVRAVGYGSPAMRLLAFEEMMQIAGEMDEVGRYNLLRDKVAARVGWAMVDRYLPKKPGTRPTLDQKFAILENAAITAGGDVALNEDDNDFIHCQIHGAMLTQHLQAMQQIQQGDVDTMQKLALVFGHGIPHFGGHVQRLSQDKLREAEAKQFRQLLQRFVSAYQELTNNLQEMQQKAAQQAQQQGGQPPQQDPKIAQMMQEHAVKMNILVDTHKLKMGLKQQDAQQKLAIRDAEAAQKVRLQQGQPDTAVDPTALPGAPGSVTAPPGSPDDQSGQSAFFHTAAGNPS